MDTLKDYSKSSKAQMEDNFNGLTEQIEDSFIRMGDKFEDNPRNLKKQN